MSNNLFSNFKYVVRDDIVYKKDVVKVKVFYLYKKIHPVIKTLYIPKAGGQNDTYYINQAKKIINENIKDGSLQREHIKQKKQKNKKTIIGIAIAAVAVTGIAVGGHFLINALKPKVDPGPWYKYADWWNYCSNGIEGSQATVDDIGKEVNLEVNGQIHKVRLIDVDKDTDSVGNKIHTTFEFANLLSDENGYSLATYWQNTNNTLTANFNYMNSTIRAVLNGNDYEGSSKSDINYFQYFGEDEDYTDESKGTTGQNKYYSLNYKNKSVLSMLPAGLTKVLATPSKYINTFNYSEDQFVETTINDKLFLLSAYEMGYKDDDVRGQEASTTTYKYYRGHIDYEDSIRTKRQVKGADGARKNPLYADDLEGAYVPSGYNSKISAAGLNQTNAGGLYWLRSPYIQKFKPEEFICEGAAWCADSAFIDGFYEFAYDRAYGIAPAFCI